MVCHEVKRVGEEAKGADFQSLPPFLSLYKLNDTLSNSVIICLCFTPESHHENYTMPILSFASCKD